MTFKDWDFNEILIKIFFILMGIVIIGGMVSTFVIAIHDEFFLKAEYKSDILFLDDVQYMDNGKILYRFGDKVIKDRLLANTFNVNEYYEVVYIKYLNAWGYKNNIWFYKEIRTIPKTESIGGLNG